MADIFISYAREDEGRIRELGLALEKHGWSIFWDRRIPAGKSWQTYIGQALSDAKCVIVAWSHQSINSKWVNIEATDAEERGVIVPILLDPVRPPLAFRGIQSADLTYWKSGHPSPNFEQLIQDITGVIGGRPPQPVPDELATPRTEPAATPRAIPAEPPPHEPAPPKPEPQKVQPREPEPPEPPGKKSPNLLIGAVIAAAIAIVVVWAVWSSREPSTPERVVEAPSAKTPESLPKAPPEVKKPEPPPAPAKPVSKPTVRPAEPKVSEIKPAAKAPAQRTFTNSIGMSFVLIPAGNFTMGSPTNERDRGPGEKQHPVTISKPFYLQTTEVTQRQWTQVIGSNPSYFNDCGDDCPVEFVGWDEAQEFIKKLNQKESGARYRLPTEAEWEYACRAGSKGRFSFGDEEARLGEYAWYWDNSDKKTHPVGKKKPNAWGLYDMGGNVYEWVQDCWHKNYDKAPGDGSAWLEKDGGNCGLRVARGGSWESDPRDVRASDRGKAVAWGRGGNVGFRLAQDIE